MRILLRTHPTDEYWDRTSHAVIDLDVELARLIVSRHRALLKTKKADPDLVEAQYADGSVTYFDDLEPDEILEEDALETFWDQGWVELPSGVDLARLSEARTEGDYLVIGSDYFHWVCSPRHSSVNVLTETLRFDVFQTLL